MVDIEYSTVTGEGIKKQHWSWGALRLAARNVLSIDLSPLSESILLTELDLSRNHLKQLDLTPLSKCTELRDLCLPENDIQNIDLRPLSGCTNLRKLVLFRNQLDVCDLRPLKTCSKLEDVVLFGNQLQHIDLGPFVAYFGLRHLDVSHNQLRDIELKPLSKCNRLQELCLEDNQIESIDLKPLTDSIRLERLTLQSNRLRSIDISPLFGCKSLYDLRVGEDCELKAWGQLRNMDEMPYALKLITQRIDWSREEELGREQRPYYGIPQGSGSLSQGEVQSPKVSIPGASSESAVSPQGVVSVKSGVDAAGENLKIAVKVVNEGGFAITGVTVTLDAPEGIDYAANSTAAVRLGSIPPNGGFQSAVFWLKPNRCIDDSYGGVVVYRDALDKSHSIEIPRRRLVNICPMLEGIESPRKIFAECKYGGLQRNSAAYKFAGDPSVAFRLANARMAALQPAERTEENVGKAGYLAYACVVGKTKYGDKMFAAEIQVSGNPAGGVLTLTVYSDDNRILAGFFVDVMAEVREHMQILGESSQPKPTACPNCGAPLDLAKLDSARIYVCESCGSRGKVPPWMV